jgi:hypothetical protein
MYSTLARMTKDILAMLIAVVKLERVFSSSDDVILYRRNRLQDDTIHAIMLFKYDFAREANENIISVTKMTETELHELNI